MAFQWFWLPLSLWAFIADVNHNLSKNWQKTWSISSAWFDSAKLPRNRFDQDRKPDCHTLDIYEKTFWDKLLCIEKHPGLKIVANQQNDNKENNKKSNGAKKIFGSESKSLQSPRIIFWKSTTYIV